MTMYIETDWKIHLAILSEKLSALANKGTTDLIVFTEAKLGQQPTTEVTAKE